MDSKILVKLIEERDALKAEVRFLRDDNTLLQAENVNLNSIIDLQEKATQVLEAGRQILTEKATSSNRFSTFNSPATKPDVETATVVAPPAA